MNHAILRLSEKDNHKKYFDLKFKLLENHFVKKWIHCVLEAQQNQYPISEPWAMYNLNNSMNETFIKDNLNRLMLEVDSVEKLFDMHIDSLDDQDKLNRIHSIFEYHHGKLDEWKSNPLFKNKPAHFIKNLSQINQFVHACEGRDGSPRIRVVWFDLPKYKTFVPEDYDLFTNSQTFGSIYHLYSDVGKNIESLAEDNDDHHHDFVPNLHYSADCVVFFASRDENTVKEIEKKQQNFVIRNQDYLSSKGYSIGDPRLTTGRIELARLETNLTQKDMLAQLKNYNNIQSFFLA